MNVITRRILRWISSKSYDDGAKRCNALALNLIVNLKAEKMLDVGCGDGTITLEFAKVVKARSIYGVEFTDEHRTKAEEKGIICVKSDMNERWDFESNFFDFILSSQSIEHVHNTRRYLQECYRCLKPGGVVLVLTANLASWINIPALVFGWQPFGTTDICGWRAIGNPLIWHADLEIIDQDFLDKYYSAGVIGTVGHVRVLAYAGLKDLMKKSGFVDIDIYSRGYLPFWGRLSDFFCKLDKRHGYFLIAKGRKPSLQLKEMLCKPSLR